MEDKNNGKEQKRLLEGNEILGNERTDVLDKSIICCLIFLGKRHS